MLYFIDMIFDLHVHTSISPCSNIPIEKIVSHAKNTGLDGLCITDHGTMDALKQLDEGIQPNGLVVIIGMEYETRDGDFLVFGPYENLKPGLDAMALLHHVNQTDGAAIGAHPFRKDRPLTEGLIKNNYCTIIESVNGRNLSKENSELNLWREKYNFTEVGGSDAHSLQELGRTCTRFTTPIRSKSDLIKALQKGFCSPVIK